MSILIVGVNYRTCPLPVLERARLSADDMVKALITLTSSDDIREAVVLSTCHRTEIYVVAERFHGAYGAVRDFFVDHTGLAPDDLHPHLTNAHDQGAVQHLFQVVSGLESMVIGESEILGQVRRAWDTARAESAAKSTLNLLFRHALETGKRVRTETAIGRSTSSISHAAVDMAHEFLGHLGGRRALVLGAGEMGDGIAVALADHGVVDTIVANRTEERALRLVERTGGRSVALADAMSLMGTVDVVLTSLATEAAVIDRETVAASRSNDAQPLLIIDVAVPRNVEPAVATLPGVTLLDLDDLRDWAAAGQMRRAAQADSARAIVDEEVERFGMEMGARQAAPLVARLHELGASICRAELDRHAPRLTDMDQPTRDAVESIAHGIVAKLLHRPSVRLKHGAGTPSGERNAAAVRELFDLHS